MSTVINGNISMGTTLSPWESADSAFEIKNGGFWATSSDSVALSQNCYFASGGYRYKVDGPASIIIQDGTNILLRTAASGLSGAVIDWLDTVTVINGGLRVTNSVSSDNTSLNWVERATATLNITGLTTAVTTTARFERICDTVHLSIDSASGTSNSTALTITGVPLNFRPSSSRSFTLRGINNSIGIVALAVLSGGTISLYIDFGGSGWTASGTKGIYTFEASYSV